MTRLVTFSKPQAPHGIGDTRLVSDDVADKLGRAGVISDSQPWGEPEVAMPAAQKPRRPAIAVRRPGAPQAKG